MSCCPCEKSDLHKDKEEIINDNIKNNIEDKEKEQESGNERKQFYQQEAFYKKKNIKSKTENDTQSQKNKKDVISDILLDGCEEANCDNDIKNEIKDKGKNQKISNERKQVCLQGNITVETLSEADEQYFDYFFQKYKDLESGGKPEFVVTIKSSGLRHIFFLTEAATKKLIEQIKLNKVEKEKNIFNSKVFNVTKVFPNSTDKDEITTYRCYLIQSGKQIPLINRLEYDNADIKKATGKIEVDVFKHDKQFFFRPYQGTTALLNDQFLPEDFNFQTLHTALTKSLEQQEKQHSGKNNQEIEGYNKETINQLNDMGKT